LSTQVELSVVVKVESTATCCCEYLQTPSAEFNVVSYLAQIIISIRLGCKISKSAVLQIHHK